MDKREQAMRLGCYAGLAAVKLGDNSYARRFVERNLSEVTAEEYFLVANEIQQRLIEGGHIQPDEDPYDEVRKAFEKAPRIGW